MLKVNNKDTLFSVFTVNFEYLFADSDNTIRTNKI